MACNGKWSQNDMQKNIMHVGVKRVEELMWSELSVEVRDSGEPEVARRH
jgi:hypothetical protein